MKNYLKRTWKNKLVALLLQLVSLIPIWLDKDATILVLMIPFSIFLFFAPWDCMGDGDDK